MALWWPRTRQGGLPARPLPTRSSALSLAALAVLASLVSCPAARAQSSPSGSTAVPLYGAEQVPAQARREADRRFLAQRGIALRPGAVATPPAEQLRAARSSHQILLRQANDSAATLRPETSGATTPGVWQPLGPAQVTTATYGAVTGRITSLIADPNDSTGNTLYLGSTGGGVWKSTTAAGSPANVVFTALTDNLSAFSNTLGSLSIGALTVQPTSSGVILAGTGDPNGALDSYYGVGILRSVDGGSTWSLIGGSKDAQQGGLQNYSFTGEGFAGFAWSGVNSNLVVAAVGQSAEGMLVNAGPRANMEAGLYYSTDAGQTWYLGIIEDDSTHIVQSPNTSGSPPGNPATSVIWNPVRKRFYAAVRFHGYYESTDGVTWTRLASQPSPNLAYSACPTNPGGTGQASCPLFRGALAVQPVTGDLFALTTDVNNQDQGLFRDVCSTSGIAVTSCASSTVVFSQQLPSAALEAGNGDATIPQADYDLTLAAVPSQQDTILFAGTEDIYRCSLANSCAWRNTTNVQTCAAGMVAPSQHATESTFGSTGLLYFANDGGLWRSTDTVAQTGSVCASTDAAHFQNLNRGIGSLAEISHFSISPASASTVLAGIGGFGTVATTSGSGAWQQLLTGEGSYTAIDRANPQNWYTDAGSGVAIHRCTAGSACNAAGFGLSAAVGSGQVAHDADYFAEAAPWILDPLNNANLVVGTCRVWRGPATGGSAWSSTNLLSSMLDGNQQAACDGNAALRSLGGGVDSLGASGSERMFAGMAGPEDGGGVFGGHLYTSVIAQAGGQTTWTDLYHSTVTNSSNQPQFNQGGWAISSIAVDPHDATGQTVYVTIQGFSGNGYSQGEIYGSTDAGAHWLNLTNSLPLAPANSVVVDPNQASTVYVALDTGVYYTQNISACSDPNQNCWSVYGSGLPNAPVTELHVYSGGTASAIEAATYGRGIWSLGLITASGEAILTPTSQSFGSQQVQTTSAAATFTLQNNGGSPLAISQVTTTGDYAQTNSCGSSLAVSASCTIQVTLTPTNAGDRPGLLTVYANVGNGSLSSTLDGTGIAAGALTVSPASLSFPATTTGATSAAQSATVQNTGGETVQLQTATVTSSYQLTADSCGASLAPGASCLLQVAFAPTATGDRPGSLTIPSNLAASPVIVSLDGSGVAPGALTLSPASLTFASTAVGSTTAAQSITLTNSGGSPVQLQAPALSGDYQLSSTNCGSTLLPGGSCTDRITFTPSATGSRPGLLTVQASVAGGQVSAALSGTGVAPVSLAFSPSSLVFPSTTQGAASAAISITLTNSGGATAQLQAASVTGDYTIGANTCHSTLAPGASCTLAVTFRPSTTGDRPGQLAIPANIAGGQVTASLDGTGVAPPALTLNPASLNFPSEAQGTTSASQSITFTNSGGSTVQMQAPSITGDFAISANGCGATLAAGASCATQITFTPTATGTRNGTLTVLANVSGGQANAQLTGTGVTPPALTLSPTSLAFSTTAQGATSTAQSITVTNIGGAPAQMQAPTVTGDFEVTSNGCTGTLAPSTSCEIQIEFAPTATGNRTGVLTVNANVSGGEATAQLSGNGVAPAALTVSPSSLIFPATTTGVTAAARPVQLTSTGGVPVQLQAPTITGDYAVSTNSCGSSLAVGASCTIQITFTPTAAGDRPGQLTVPASVSGGQVTASLDGAGLTPAALVLNPGSLAFSATAQGSTSAAQAISVSNTGGSPAQLQAPTISGDFAVSANTCGSTLAAGAACSLQVVFAPTATGSRTGLLTLPANVSGGSATAMLSGTGVAPAAVTLSPSPVVFGSVVQGSASSAQSITVLSTGGLAVQLQAPTITGDYQISANSCPSSLAPSSNCVIQVIFHPGSTGDRPGVLTLPGSMPGGQATDSLDGTGLAPGALSLSPLSLTFSSTILNSSSPDQSVVVTNGGGVSVTLQAATVSGDYQIDSDTCGSSLAPGANCSLGISFHPTAAGDRPGELQVPGNVTGGKVIASLDGTGIMPPSVAFTPASVNFGNVAQGVSSAPAPITLTNGGGATLHLQSVIAAGDYAITANACGSSLNPSASCAIQITFTPSALGTRTGTLTIVSDAANSPAVASLTGNGVAPAAVTLTPTAASYPATIEGAKSAAMMFTATNSGGLPASLGAPALTGDYQLTANGCGSTLAAGASCTLQVVFAPASAGDRPGMLALPGQFSGSPATASLDGTGLTPGTVTFAAATLSFAPLVVNATSTPQSITVENTGGGTVTLQAPTISGDYEVTADSCGSTLAGGASCTIQVAFHPSAAGDRPGQLVLPASSGQAVVALDGTGLTAASLTITPGSLNFGGVVEQTASSSSTVTITNGGGVPAHLQSIASSGDFAIASNTCGSSVASGSACSAQVVFTPSALGSRSGVLTVVSDAPGSPASATLVGTGLAPPNVILSPSSLTFAATVEGANSPAKTVTATNNGGVPVQISAPTLTGDYQLNTTTCTGTLGAGASCTLQVSFVPVGAGDRAGALSITGQFSASPASIPLDGTGLAPGSLTLTPNALNFGSVITGASSAAQAVTVANPGGVAVQLGSISVTTSYAITGNTCGSSVAPGGSCTVQVVFSPITAGELAGLLTVPGNITGGQVAASLDGAGIAPGSLGFSPLSLSFPATIVGASSASQSITVTNTGGASLPLGAPSVSGDYQLVSGTCGSSLAPAATCSLQVLFHPSAAGDRRGTLAISGGQAAAQQAQAALDGTGLAPAHLSFSPVSLAFGSVAESRSSAAQSTTLANTGGVTAELRAAVLTGDYQIAANSCGSTLSSGSSCAVQVTFNPVAPGDRPGTLTFTTVDNASSAAVALDGTGTIPPALVVTPTALTFSAIGQGTSSAAQSVTVANTGSTVLQLQAPVLQGNFSLTADTCTGAPLHPNFSCTLSIAFTPTGGGQRSGTLIVSDSAESHTVVLSGTGLSAATDTLSQATLTFGLQVVGTVSPAQSVTLTNSGGATLNSIATQVIGPFAATNNCGSQLGGGLSCAIAVTYIPGSAGTESGQLVITDAQRSQAVALTGQGALPPQAIATPNNLAFGAYAINTATPAQLVTFTNNGQTTVSGFTAATGSGSFAITSNTCGDTVAAGASCAIGVAFAPQSVGNQVGVLTLASPSLNGPLTVALSGSGEDFQIQINGPNSAIVANGQTATYQLVATPTGSSAGALAMTCIGAPANASCTINPVSLSIAGNATASASISIVTGLKTAASARTQPPQRRYRDRWSLGATLALLLPFVALRGNARRTWLVLLAAVALTLAPTACGVHASGGSSSPITPPTGVGITPPGKYSITITGSFPGAERTAVVILVVQ